MSTKRPKVTWDHIPDAVVLRIFMQLEPIELYMVSLTSKHMRSLSGNNVVWKQVYRRRFQVVSPYDLDWQGFNCIQRYYRQVASNTLRSLTKPIELCKATKSSVLGSVVHLRLHGNHIIAGFADGNLRSFGLDTGRLETEENVSEGLDRVREERKREQLRDDLAAAHKNALFAFKLKQYRDKEARLDLWSSSEPVDLAVSQIGSDAVSGASPASPGQQATTGPRDNPPVSHAPQTSPLLSGQKDRRKLGKRYSKRRSGKCSRLPEGALEVLRRRSSTGRSPELSTVRARPQSASPSRSPHSDSLAGMKELALGEAASTGSSSCGSDSDCSSASSGVEREGGLWFQSSAPRDVPSFSSRLRSKRRGRRSRVLSEFLTCGGDRACGSLLGLAVVHRSLALVRFGEDQTREQKRPPECPKPAGTFIKRRNRSGIEHNLTVGSVARRPDAAVRESLRFAVTCELLPPHWLAQRLTAATCAAPVTCEGVNQRTALVTGHADGGVCAWTSAGEFITEWKAQVGPAVALVVRDQDVLVSGSQGALALWRLGHSSPAVRLSCSSVRPEAPTCTALGKRAAVAGWEDGLTCVWGRSGVRVVEERAHESAVVCCGVMVGGDSGTHFRFATGGEDGAVVVWNVLVPEQQKKNDSFSKQGPGATQWAVLGGHGGRVHQVHMDPHKVVSCSEDGTIKLWSMTEGVAASGSLLRTLRWRGARSPVVALAVGTSVVVGGTSDGSVQAFVFGNPMKKFSQWLADAGQDDQTAKADAAGVEQTTRRRSGKQRLKERDEARIGAKLAGRKKGSVPRPRSTPNSQPKSKPRSSRGSGSKRRMKFGYAVDVNAECDVDLVSDYSTRKHKFF